MPTYLDTWSKTNRSIGKQSITTQARAAIAQLVGSGVSGKDPATLAVFPDVSHWNGKLDVSKMKPYIHGLMAKCADGKQMIQGAVTDPNTYVDDTFSDNVQQCYDNGLPVIAYYYWQPDNPPAAKKENDRYYQALLYSLRNKKPGVSFHGLRLDVEEKSAIFHTMYRDRLQTFYAWCLEDFGDIIPVDFYTSVGHASSIPALGDWLASATSPKVVHWAQWVMNTKTRATWAQVRDYTSRLNFKVQNYTGWRAVQWTSSFYGMEGCGEGEMDLSLFNGTPEEFRAYHKYNRVVTPPPVDPGTPPVEPPAGEGVQTQIDALTARVAELERWRKS